MIEQGRISSQQMALLIYSTIVSSGILLIPNITGKVAGRDLWLSPIWASLIGLLFIVAVLRMNRMFPRDTFIQYSQRVLGKLLGKAFGLLYIFYFLYVNSLVMKVYGEFVSSIFLKETPPAVIYGGMALLISFAVRGGLEVLGRLAQLLLPISIFVFIFLMFMTLPEWELHNALPVMGIGMLPSLKGAATPTIWFINFLLISFIHPFVSDKRHVTAYSLAAWFSIMLILAAACLNALFIFGERVGTFAYPFAEVVRYVSIGYFFQHIDAFFLSIWIMATFVQISTFQYAVVSGTAQWLNLIEYRPLALPLGLLLVLMCYWSLPNMQAFNRYIATSHVWFSATMMLLAIGLFITAWISRKIRQPDKSSSE